MDGIEARVDGVARVVRLQIQSAAGKEASRRYGVELTPTFVVFDRSGAPVERLRTIDLSVAERLRGLASAR